MAAKKKAPGQLGFKARKPQDPGRFRAAAEEAEKSYRRKVKEIAGRAWGEVIVPICRKHKLDYMTGNGETFFIGMHEGEEVHIGDAEDAEKKYDGAFSFLVPVFQDVINIELTYNDFLGYYIRDTSFLP